MGAVDALWYFTENGPVRCFIPRRTAFLDGGQRSSTLPSAFSLLYNTNRMAHHRSSVCGYFFPVVAWAGVIISLVLVISHYRGASLVCGPAAGCDAVTSSVYSRIAGVPLALVGLGAWVTLLLGFLAMLFLPVGFFRRCILFILRGMICFGAIVSAGLIAIQAFRIHAYCPLCLSSAGCFFVLGALDFAVSVDEFPTVPLTAAPALIIGTLGSLSVFIMTLLMIVPSSASDDSKILATLDGHAITDNDLPTSLRLSIQPLEEQAAKIRRDWVDQHLDELVLDQEAKRQGTSSKNLLAKETEGVLHVTDAKIVGWRNDHPDELMVSNEEIASRLKLSKESNAEDAYIARLRKIHAATILVHPPTPPIVYFNMAHAQIDGPANAPAVFVVFSDFECPFCRQLGANLRAVRKKLGDRVAIAFKNLPLEQIHPKAHAFALAAIAAGEQGKFWQYHDALISQDLAADDATLIEQARNLGLDVPRFTEALHSKRVTDHLDADVKEAESLGLQETPTLFLNGKLSGGLHSTHELVQLVQ